MKPSGGQGREADFTLPKLDGDDAHLAPIGDSECWDSITDRTVFTVSEYEFRQLEELLDFAPEPNDALRLFVRQRPPWVREP